MDSPSTVSLRIELENAAQAVFLAAADLPNAEPSVEILRQAYITALYEHEINLKTVSGTLGSSRDLAHRRNKYGWILGQGLETNV